MKRRRVDQDELNIESLRLSDMLGLEGVASEGERGHLVMGRWSPKLNLRTQMATCYREHPLIIHVG